MAGEELQRFVDGIVASTAGLPDPATLASWSPRLNGDIDIRILADGSWQHAGEAITREGLVRFFASLLRREEDDDYYLVTPVEKWRILVDRHPLVAIDCERQAAGDAYWLALLNTGGRCRIGGVNRLHAAGTDAPPYIDLPNRLSAQLTRAAWYRLVEAASVEKDRAVIVSAGEVIDLGSTL